MQLFGSFFSKKNSQPAILSILCLYITLIFCHLANFRILWHKICYISV